MRPGRAVILDRFAGRAIEPVMGVLLGIAARMRVLALPVACGCIEGSRGQCALGSATQCSTGGQRGLNRQHCDHQQGERAGYRSTHGGHCAKSARASQADR